jgi:hypothetical protein
MRSFLSGETTPAMLDSIGLRKLESFLLWLKVMISWEFYLNFNLIRLTEVKYKMRLKLLLGFDV